MMNKIRRSAGALVLGLAAFLLASGLEAAPGAADAAFLRLDAGPRQLAMGGAGVALGGDVYSMVYNPALVGTVLAREVGFAHAEWIESTRYDDLAYAHPTRNYGYFGLRLQRLGYGTMPGFDAVGGPQAVVSASDFLAQGAYAKKIRRTGLLWGQGIKYARETLGPVAAKTILYDFGVIYTPKRHDWLGDWTAGAALRNFGPSLKYDQAATSSRGDISLGLSTRRFDESLTLAADLHLPFKQSYRFNAGVEYYVSDSVILRTGLEYPQSEGFIGGLGLRAGLGFRVGSFNVDYAFAPLGELGNAHHFSLRLAFGGLSEKAYEDGVKLLKSQRYAEAILKFKEVLDYNSKHPTAKRRMRQAYEMWKKEKPDEVK